MGKPASKPKVDNRSTILKGFIKPTVILNLSVSLRSTASLKKGSSLKTSALFEGGPACRRAGVTICRDKRVLC